MPQDPLQLRRAMDVIISKAKEVFTQPLYDSNDIAAATTGDVIYFNNTIGAVGILRTNMELAGQLPYPRQFLIQQVSVAPWPSQAVAVASLLSTSGTSLLIAQTTLTLRISDKIYLRGPSAFFPAGIGVDGYAAAGAGAAIDAPHSGIASPTARFNLLRPGQLLKPSENFNVTLNVPVALAGLTPTPSRVYVIFWGAQMRAVQ